MGFWSGFNNVITLGGAHRMGKAKQRHARCLNEYHRLVRCLVTINANSKEIIERLRQAFGRTRLKLSVANRILYPKCLTSHTLSRETANLSRTNGSQALAPLRHSGNFGLGSTELAMIGVGSGTAAALAAWSGVQILGTASTGAAISGIYGAAAHNAGWAVFGGGAFAAGGGGMTLGHVILPGIGTVIAVGFAAITTHIQADRINEMCDQIESVNKKNALALHCNESELWKLQGAESIFNRSDQQLQNAVRIACRRLRRFGWLTVFSRWIRFKLNGQYYTQREQHYVRSLEVAVDDFMMAFGVH
jgi:hypothetical protein